MPASPTRRTAVVAALCSVAAVLSLAGACGSSTSSPPPLPKADAVYLQTVRADQALAKFSDLDLMTVGHQDCAEISDTNEHIPASYNDSLEAAGFTSQNDRMVLLTAAIVNYCPQFSDLLESNN